MVEVINMEFSSIQLKMLSYLIDFFIILLINLNNSPSLINIKHNSACYCNKNNCQSLVKSFVVLYDYNLSYVSKPKTYQVRIFYFFFS